MTNEVHCPECGSTQISANKKGFSGSNAVAGALLTGGIGLLAGTAGSNKIIITCLNCGHQFFPGGKPVKKKASKGSYKFMKVFMIILLCLIAPITIAMAATGAWVGFGVMLGMRVFHTCN